MTKINSAKQCHSETGTMQKKKKEFHSSGGIKANG
jgi:hypothetical protein